MHWGCDLAQISCDSAAIDAPPGLCQHQHQKHVLLVQYPYEAAVFLNDTSRELALELVPPWFDTVLADHMTLAQRPSLDQALALPLGQEVVLEVEGAAADNSTQVRCCRQAGAVGVPQLGGPTGGENISVVRDWHGCVPHAFYPSMWHLHFIICAYQA